MRGSAVAIWALVGLVGSVDACSGGRLRGGAGAGHDGGGNGRGDGSAAGDDGGRASCDDDHPCSSGWRCHGGACILDQGSCQGDDECQGDTYCDCEPPGDGAACADGACVSWGQPPRGTFDPGCQGPAFSASAFQPPIERCRWRPSGGSANVIMTPIVVDLDGDGSPEIVFVSYNDAGLVALHGADCSTYFEKPSQGLAPFAQIAAADLDGDKHPEIIALGADRKVRVYDHQGTLLATAPQAYQGVGGGSECSAPAIADVDGDGTPEILVSGQVLRYRGGALASLWNQAPSSGSTATWGTLSLFADLDGDGRPEAVTGLKVYDGQSGADETPSAMAALDGAGAYPQVADFNGDGKPDILLVQSGQGAQQVTIVDYAANRVIFGPYGVSDGGWGGPATIADFDGDGVPDFGLASSSHYYVYAMKCAAQPKPAECTGANPGVMWERATLDGSSGGTGSSVFDFNGDGIAEVVYRDECWLRVMNGPDGRTVFAQQVTSGTCLEMPLVADVDGDGHADLVVPSDNVQGNDHCKNVPEGQTGQGFSASTQGVFVLRDPMNRWVGSRGIWNQHTYHITNVADDTSVPPVETPNWTSWNDYRQNVQSIDQTPMALADATAGPWSGVDQDGTDCIDTWTLHATLCNRGTASVAAHLPATFYVGDPRLDGAVTICTARTATPLAPGACEPVQCDWHAPLPDQPVDLWLRTNDDGQGGHPATECKPGNDLLHRATCSRIG